MDNKENNNNIFYWIKMHKILTVCLAIIVYIVIPILPFIQSPIGIFSKEDATLFLSYYGTIISGVTGGALTLIGVIWTINYEKKAREENFKTQEERRQEDFNNQEVQRKKDLAIQYRPFFRPIVPMKIDGNSFEENAFPSNSNEHSFETNYTKDIIVKIKNSGRGEAIIKDITNDISISQTDKIRVRVNNDLNDCIFPKQYFKLELNITIYDYKCLKSSDMYYDFPITIEYTDFLKQNSYKKKICVLIKNTTSDKENNQNTPTKFVVSIQEPLIKEDEEE